MGPRLLFVSVVLVAGCSSGTASLDGPVRAEGEEGAAMTRAGLEEGVARMFDGSSRRALRVRCRGTLPRSGTQDCRVRSRDGAVGLRVAARRGGLTATPFLPRHPLATAIARTLRERGRAASDVECHGELLGERGRSAECTVTMAGDRVPVVATVTSVSGLMIDFEFGSR